MVKDLSTRMPTLRSLVASYILAWRGHTPHSAEAYTALQDKLSEAPMSEILEEYNYITANSLWTPSLSSVFYDELLMRLFQDTTFAIVRDDGVKILVGFDTAYPVPSHTIQYTDQDMGTITKTNIVRLLLRGHITALVDDTSVVALENGTGETVYLKDSKDLDRIPVRVDEAPDWSLAKRMYQALRDDIPAIIDE